MKKKLIVLILIGFPSGMAFTQVLTIIYSFLTNGSSYQATTQELLLVVNHEIYAVILQNALSGVLGSICFASVLIWETDEWSLTKQTVLHFILIYCSSLVMGSVLQWLTLNPVGLLLFTAVVVIIYFIVWLVMFHYYRIQVRKMGKTSVCLSISRVESCKSNKLEIL